MIFELSRLDERKFLSQLREKHYAICDLPQSALPLVAQATEDICIEESLCRDGFFIPSRMPISCIKLQALRHVRNAFQAVYPIEELVFSFDVGQYVAPGEDQSYKGISPSKTNDLVALIALAEENIRPDICLKPGQVLFYSMKHFLSDNELFKANRDSKPWIGLFTSFYPKTYDTYGQNQRKLMLLTGKSALLMRKEQPKVVQLSRKKQEFNDEDLVRRILRHSLVARPELYYFDNEKSKLNRYNYKYVEQPVHSTLTPAKVAPSDSGPEDVETDAERASSTMRQHKKRSSSEVLWRSTPEKKKPCLRSPKDLAAFSAVTKKIVFEEQEEVIQEEKEEEENKTETLIDQLHAAMRKFKDPQPASLREVFNEIAHTNVLGDLGNDLYVTTSEDEEDDVQRPSTKYGSLRLIKHHIVDGVNGITYCQAQEYHQAQEAKEGLTGDVLFIGETTDPKTLNENCHWCFLLLPGLDSHVLEVRSSEPLVLESVMKAVRLRQCKYAGYRITDSKEHCKSLYKMLIKHDSVLTNDRLYVITEFHGFLPGVACKICSTEFAAMAGLLEIDVWRAVGKTKKEQAQFGLGVQAVTSVFRMHLKDSSNRDPPSKVLALSPEEIVSSHALVCDEIRGYLKEYMRNELNENELKKMAWTALNSDQTLDKMKIMSQDPRYRDVYEDIFHVFFKVLLYDIDGKFEKLFKKFV